MIIGRFSREEPLEALRWWRTLQTTLVCNFLNRVALWHKNDFLVSFYSCTSNCSFTIARVHRLPCPPPLKNIFDWTSLNQSSLVMRGLILHRMRLRRPGWYQEFGGNMAWTNVTVIVGHIKILAVFLSFFVSLHVTLLGLRVLLSTDPVASDAYANVGVICVWCLAYKCLQYISCYRGFFQSLHQWRDRYATWTMACSSTNSPFDCKSQSSMFQQNEDACRTMDFPADFWYSLLCIMNRALIVMRDSRIYM